MAIAFMGGPAVLQALGGVIVGAFPATDGAAPAIAYQALFAFLAGLVTLACLAYLRIPDAKPSAGFATGRSLIGGLSGACRSPPGQRVEAAPAEALAPRRRPAIAPSPARSPRP